MQHLVADEACTECAELYLKADSRGGAGGPCVTAHTRVHAEAAYQRKAELALADENCFKIFIVSSTSTYLVQFLASIFSLWYDKMHVTECRTFRSQDKYPQ